MIITDKIKTEETSPIVKEKGHSTTTTTTGESTNGTTLITNGRLTLISTTIGFTTDSLLVTRDKDRLEAMTIDKATEVAPTTTSITIAVIASVQTGRSRNKKYGSRVAKYIGSKEKGVPITRNRRKNDNLMLILFNA